MQVIKSCPICKTEDCEHAVQQTLNELGRVDILFNNVGVLHRTSVLETSEEEWDLVHAINLKSAFLFSKYLIPTMIENGGGVIVNSGSGWSFVGGDRAVTYCVTKSAMVNLTRCLAIEHGKHNIRVNCICPGDTNTNLIREESRQLGINLHGGFPSKGRKRYKKQYNSQTDCLPLGEVKAVFPGHGFLTVPALMYPALKPAENPINAL